MKTTIFSLALSSSLAHAALAPVDHNACRVRIPIYAGDTSQVESYIYGDWMTEDDAMNQATSLVDDGTQVAVICKPAQKGTHAYPGPLLFASLRSLAPRQPASVA